MKGMISIPLDKIIPWGQTAIAFGAALLILILIMVLMHGVSAMLPLMGSAGGIAVAACFFGFLMMKMQKFAVETARDYITKTDEPPVGEDHKKCGICYRVQDEKNAFCSHCGSKFGTEE
jgi:hypothetical protein